MPDKCPLCELECRISVDSPPTFLVECANCGKFILGRNAEFVRTLENYERAVLSHTVHRHQRNGDPYNLLNILDKEFLKQEKLPNVAEQANNLILYLGDNLQSIGPNLNINYHKIVARIGALNGNGVRKILGALKENNLISFTPSWSPETSCSLEFDGWIRYDELIKGRIESRYGFMAMKYDDPELDLMFENHFKKAVGNTGYELRRLDEKPKAGLIDDRLRVEIRRSRFLIADLTHGNRGAYWEAGFAEGLGKPVIYTCKKQYFEDKDKGVHFDTNHHQAILWEDGNIDDACKRLTATVRNTFPQDAKMSDD